MITTPKEYYENLHKIQIESSPELAVLLPGDEKIYEINWNSRKIESPEFLSVEKDHYAETIYFVMDRYFDNMDLTNTVGVVQFINAKGQGRIYPIPFYDISTYAEENKVLFPWCIQGEATKEAGVVEYSIKFYKLDPAGENFIYNINTLTAKSEVLHGMDVLEDNEDYNYPVEVIEKVFQYLNDINNKLDEKGYNGVD